MKYIFLFSILILLNSCASQDDNIKLLGDNVHIMTDENDNKWRVQRKIGFGDNYRLHLLKRK
jgi:hypothetical protein